MYNRVLEPFILAEIMITNSSVYGDIPELYVFPKTDYFYFSSTTLQQPNPSNLTMFDFFMVNRKSRADHKPRHDSTRFSNVWMCQSYLEKIHDINDLPKRTAAAELVPVTRYTGKSKWDEFDYCLGCSYRIVLST